MVVFYLANFSMFIASTSNNIYLGENILYTNMTIGLKMIILSC